MVCQPKTVEQGSKGGGERRQAARAMEHTETLVQFLHLSGHLSKGMPDVLGRRPSFEEQPGGGTKYAHRHQYATSSPPSPAGGVGTSPWRGNYEHIHALIVAPRKSNSLCGRRRDEEHVKCEHDGDDSQSQGLQDVHVPDVRGVRDHVWMIVDPSRQEESRERCGDTEKPRELLGLEHSELMPGCSLCKSYAAVTISRAWTERHRMGSAHAAS